VSIEPSENETSSPIQRLLIGAATLIVIVLTVVAAIFLALQDQPGEETPLPPPTEIGVLPPTATSTPPAASFTSTPTSPPVPDTATPTVTSTPAEAASPPSPTATSTDTPSPAPPTSTATPVVIIVTATPPPSPPTTESAVTGVCQPPPTWITYVVQPGDTLNSLSTRTNISVFELQEVNCLASFNIQPGQSIFLPFDPPPPTPRPLPTATGTRLPTPTRTSTPVTPIIRDVAIRIDEGASLVRVIVTGENFRSREQGFRAELVGPRTIELQLGEARTSTSFEATAPLDEDLLTGEYDLTVINPDGRLAIRPRVFPPSNATATPTPQPPRIDNITPDAGRVSQNVRVTLDGRNFGPFTSGFEVELIPRAGGSSRFYVPNEDDRPATATRFDILIQVGDLTPGLYDVRVINPDGQFDTEISGYEALPP
jgi:LysM repeat protein